MDAWLEIWVGCFMLCLIGRNVWWWFVLRLYRLSTSDGFISAASQNSFRAAFGLDQGRGRFAQRASTEPEVVVVHMRPM